MRFDVEASLTYDFATPCEVLLLVEAAHGPDQVVRSEALTFWPNVDAVRVDDPVTFERRTVFTGSGRINALYRAQVDVAPRPQDLAEASAMAIRDLPGAVLPFLRPSRYSPSDRLERFARHAFGDLSGGRRVMAILAWIAENVTYRAGVSDAGTTAIDTLIDRAGVCRDFTHLVIGLCRAAATFPPGRSAPMPGGWSRRTCTPSPRSIWAVAGGWSTPRAWLRSTAWSGWPRAATPPTSPS
ncbi:transglutaminase-like domain-containing protein [Caulobacter segnis]